ncbi:hypothetical protein J6590_020356 [Homalodisca vitripennis]|nr:hypothetical protein J6590_020356 [Homalodisca vitripennis]
MFKRISALKTSSSPDVLEMTTSVIRRVASTLSAPLTKLHNNSNIQGKFRFPTDVKLSKVIPVFKKGCSSYPQQDRPVYIILPSVKSSNFLLMSDSLISDLEIPFRVTLNLDLFHLSPPPMPLLSFINMFFPSHQSKSHTVTDVFAIIVEHSTQLLNKMEVYGIRGVYSGSSPIFQIIARVFRLLSLLARQIQISLKSPWMFLKFLKAGVFVALDEVDITEVHSVCFLGVRVDTGVFWCQYVVPLCSKFNSILFSMSTKNDIKDLLIANEGYSSNVLPWEPGELSALGLSYLLTAGEGVEAVTRAEFHSKNRTLTFLCSLVITAYEKEEKLMFRLVVVKYEFSYFVPIKDKAQIDRVGIDTMDSTRSREALLESETVNSVFSHTSSEKLQRRGGAIARESSANQQRYGMFIIVGDGDGRGVDVTDDDCAVTRTSCRADTSDEWPSRHSADKGVSPTPHL